MNLYLDRYRFVIAISIFIVLSAGCASGPQEDREIKRLGEKAVFDEYTGDNVNVSSVKTVSELVDSDGEKIRAEEGKSIFLVQIDTSLLFSKNEIYLNLEGEKIRGLNTGGRLFYIDGEPYKDFLHLSSSKKSVTGLYPGARVDGWIVFKGIEDFDPEKATFVLMKKSEEGGEVKKFRWSLAE